MKNYRWNKRKFIQNIVCVVFIVAFSFGISYGLLMGLDAEAKVQSENTRIWLANTERR